MYIHGTWGKKCRYINETRLYLAFLGMAWVQIECYLVFSYLLTMKMDCWIFHLVFTRVFVKHAGIKGYISLWDADFSMEPLPKPVLVLSFLFDLFPWIKSPALYSSVWTDSLIKHLLSVRYFIRPAPDMNVHWKYQEAPWDYAQLESTRDFLPSDNFPWSEFAVGHRDLEEVLFPVIQMSTNSAMILSKVRRRSPISISSVAARRESFLEVGMRFSWEWFSLLDHDITRFYMENSR